MLFSNAVLTITTKSHACTPLPSAELTAFHAESLISTANMAWSEQVCDSSRCTRAARSFQSKTSCAQRAAPCCFCMLAWFGKARSSTRHTTSVTNLWETLQTPASCRFCWRLASRHAPSSFIHHIACLCINHSFETWLVALQLMRLALHGAAAFSWQLWQSFVWPSAL